MISSETKTEIMYLSLSMRLRIFVDLATGHSTALMCTQNEIHMSLSKGILRALGPVSRSLWKGPPLLKESHFYSFGKATLRLSFTKPPLILLTKVLP